MLDKTIPRIGRVPNIITINASRINNINKIGHLTIKKASRFRKAFAPPSAPIIIGVEEENLFRILVTQFNNDFWVFE